MTVVIEQGEATVQRSRCKQRDQVAHGRLP
jgi:hypothetical protein